MSTSICIFSISSLSLSFSFTISNVTCFTFFFSSFTYASLPISIIFSFLSSITFSLLKFPTPFSSTSFNCFSSLSCTLLSNSKITSKRSILFLLSLTFRRLSKTFCISSSSFCILNLSLCSSNLSPTLIPKHLFTFSTIVPLFEPLNTFASFPYTCIV